MYPEATQIERLDRNVSNLKFKPAAGRTRAPETQPLKAFLGSPLSYNEAREGTFPLNEVDAAAATVRPSVLQRTQS